MEKRKWIQLTVILALIILVLVLLYLPTYIQAYSGYFPERTSTESELNESQLYLLNEIWGTNITMGEYYELIYPEFLDGMPQELRSWMFNKTMEWPGKRD